MILLLLFPPLKLKFSLFSWLELIKPMLVQLYLVELAMPPLDLFELILGDVVRIDQLVCGFVFQIAPKGGKHLVIICLWSHILILNLLLIIVS